MANLMTQFTTGQTVYGIVLNASGQAWNTVSGAFESAVAGHWAQYAVAMAEQTPGNLTGIYCGNFPSAITVAGVFSVLFRQQSGGSPAATDASGGMLGGLIFWTGSAEAFPLASSAAGAANVSMSATNIAANVAQIAGVSASGIVINDSHGNAAFSAAALENAPATSGSGAGPIAINQNTGGADNLRYVDSSGNGVEGANIVIYLAADWPTNPGQAQANALTGPDGRWLAPAFVQSGTYVAVFAKIGADGPDVSPPFSV